MYIVCSHMFSTPAQKVQTAVYGLLVSSICFYTIGFLVAKSSLDTAHNRTIAGLLYASYVAVLMVYIFIQLIVEQSKHKKAQTINITQQDLEQICTVGTEKIPFREVINRTFTTVS